MGAAWARALARLHSCVAVWHGRLISSMDIPLYVTEYVLLDPVSGWMELRASMRKFLMGIAFGGSTEWNIFGPLPSWTNRRDTEWMTSPTAA